MAFSLETRLPFLDYRLVEFIFGLPFEQKIEGGVTKIILRNAMKGILPEEIRNRMDKMGFVTPEDIWFRTVLRNQIYEIISSKSFAERGYFDVDKVQEAFKEHCEGKRNISFIIWRWVNLELWMRTFLDSRASSGRLGRDDHTS
jgi:asparagine synthase (glutamine-hydrolysing)